jgi:hypothetical protein
MFGEMYLFNYLIGEVLALNSFIQHFLISALSLITN